MRNLFSQTSNKLPIAISFYSNGIALSQLGSIVNNMPSLALCEFISCTPDQYESTLKTLINKFNLEMSPCYLILNNTQYQLHILVEKDIDQANLQQSIGDHIKDILDTHVKDLIFGTFDFPDTNEKFKKLFVVAVNKNILQDYLDIIHNCYLHITKVTIADLALKNICSEYTKEDETICLLSITNKIANFLICHKENIYLIRNIALPFVDPITTSSNTNTATEHSMKTLPLEIILDNLENSFSYCKNILAIPEPNRILLNIDSQLLLPIKEHLNKYAKKSTETINLQDFLKTNNEINYLIQQNCILGIGELLNATRS